MKSEKDLLMLFVVVVFLITKLRADTDTIPVDYKSKLYQCLNTCAMCVEHWETGLYNGPRCAKQCMKHKGQKIVDPDCVKLKMFNYDPEVLREHRKFLRQQNEQSNDDDD